MSTSGGSSGGTTFPDYHGAGCPEGHQTAAVAKSYRDDTNGALYWKATGAGNTGWVLGSVLDVSGTFVPTVAVQLNTGTALLMGDAASGATLTDIGAFNGTGNGAYWTVTGVDGAQTFIVQVGALAAAKNFKVFASGLVQHPAGITTAPTDSHTATAAFGALTLGTPKQNTLGYDLCVNVTVLVSAAAGGSFVMGVGSSATPTTDAASPALAIATMASFDAIVPNNYYLLIDKTGTITVGTPVTVATPL